MNIFRDMLESACPSMCLSLCPVCVQNTNNVVSQTPSTVLLLLYGKFVDTWLIH